MESFIKVSICIGVMVIVFFAALMVELAKKMEDEDEL